MSFKPTNNNNQKKHRNRKRKVIYFNPPYSLGVSTRIGAIFLKILDKCFAKPNPLYQIFNRDTVKVSYRTTPKMKQILTGHNTHFKQNKIRAGTNRHKDMQLPKSKEKYLYFRRKMYFGGNSLPSYS